MLSPQTVRLNIFCQTSLKCWIQSPRQCVELRVCVRLTGGSVKGTVSPWLRSSTASRLSDSSSAAIPSFCICSYRALADDKSLSTTARRERERERERQHETKTSTCQILIWMQTFWKKMTGTKKSVHHIYWWLANPVTFYLDASSTDWHSSLPMYARFCQDNTLLLKRCWLCMLNKQQVFLQYWSDDGTEAPKASLALIQKCLFLLLPTGECLRFYV